MPRRLPVWRPSDDQKRHWPSISGNTINGVGEAEPRRPSPVYWHPPDTIPHGPLQLWFYARTGTGDETVAEARRERQRAIDAPLDPLAEVPAERSADEWSREVKRVALASGADDVGIAAMRPAYVFEAHPVPPQKWMIVIAVAHDYGPMKSAPSTQALVEVTRQYARGTRAAKGIASFLRREGHDAIPYGGPMAGSFVLIPPAIEAGLGELGKHGSMIHPRFGASFRLACVLTDVPLVPDRPSSFGADDFCASCRVCDDACPPKAIVPEKTLVRGERRWYVDFDKCLPYFNEAMGCAICLAVCPFSRPGIGVRLVDKLAARRARAT
ncbi:MAG: 4Fe-4S dicluster domain-containing protein [Deltaproteobacteria bacterium]|nr:4Fe-4S dicluster domain-containing protein [Deltaproteobacteria bacterium]